MAARLAVILVAIAAVLQAAHGQRDPFRFERPVVVDRACVGGVGNRTNLFDIVRRDCCSIPISRLGDPRIDPCPIVTSDIINGVPGLSNFRNGVVLDEEAFNTVVEAAAADVATRSSGPNDLRVSNLRVWETVQGDRCFCPIVLIEEEDAKKRKHYGG